MASNLGIDADGTPIFQVGVDTHVARRDADGHPILTTDRATEAYWARETDGIVYLYHLPTQETYLIDGIYLDDPTWRWRLEKATKLPATANRRVTSLDLPYRDGVVAVRQGMGTGQVGLSIACLDTPGTRGISAIDEAREALAALLRDARTLTWRPGPDRSRSVEVTEVAVAEPDLRGRRAAVLSAALTVQPFWWEGDPQLTAAQVIAAGTVEFPEMAGCTGRIQDAIVRITGPFSSLTLTDPGSGTGATLSTALPAATYLYLDVSAFTAWTSGSASAWSGGTPQAVDFPAAGPLEVWPVLAGDPMSMPVRLQVAGAGFSGASQIAIRSRRWFL